MQTYRYLIYLIFLYMITQYHIPSNAKHQTKSPIKNQSNWQSTKPNLFQFQFNY